MARVTATEVKVILSTTLSDTIIDGFIAAATIMVDRLAAAPCHTAESLKQVELFLSAHLTGAREKQLTQEKIGDATDTYSGTFGSGLDGTSYGQTAKMLDCSGQLAKFMKKQVAISFGGAA